jgi:hypothetical protein
MKRDRYEYVEFVDMQSVPSAPRGGVGLSSHAPTGSWGICTEDEDDDDDDHEDVD